MSTFPTVASCLDRTRFSGVELMGLTIVLQFMLDARWLGALLVTVGLVTVNVALAFYLHRIETADDVERWRKRKEDGEI